MRGGAWRVSSVASSEQHKEAVSLRTGISTPILLLLSMLAWLSAAGQECQRRDSGPRTLVISYRCTPAKRGAFREQMLNSALPRFEKWKTEGILERYRL